MRLTRAGMVLIGVAIAPITYDVLGNEAGQQGGSIDTRQGLMNIRLSCPRAASLDVRVLHDSDTFGKVRKPVGTHTAYRETFLERESGSLGQVATSQQCANRMHQEADKFVLQRTQQGSWARRQKRAPWQRARPGSLASQTRTWEVPC